MIKVLQIFLLFSLYFSSLNLKYLKLTKMDITRFAMKLFIFFIAEALSDPLLNLPFNIVFSLLKKKSDLHMARDAISGFVLNTHLTSR